MNLSHEPARIIAGITAALVALFGVAAAFGLPISDDQRNAVLGAVAPIVVLLVALGEIIRARVWAPTSHEDAVATARRQAYADGAAHTRPELAMVPMSVRRGEGT